MFPLLARQATFDGEFATLTAVLLARIPRLGETLPMVRGVRAAIPSTGHVAYLVDNEGDVFSAFRNDPKAQ